MVTKDDNKKSKSPNVGAPKNFLIPIMLLHLREINTHGYELMEKIAKFGIESLDHGNFYRLLRQLEKDNLVTSVWDTSSGGPAKRIYSITEAGEQYLDMWAHSLSEYQKLLNQFFNLYNPFYATNFSSFEKKGQEVSNHEKEADTTVVENKTSTEVKESSTEGNESSKEVTNQSSSEAKESSSTTKPRNARSRKTKTETAKTAASEEQPQK